MEGGRKMKKNYCLVFLCLMLSFTLFVTLVKACRGEEQRYKIQANIETRGLPWLHTKKLNSMLEDIVMTAPVYDVDVIIDKKIFGWFSSRYYFTCYASSKKSLKEFTVILRNIEHCYKNNEPYLIPPETMPILWKEVLFKNTWSFDDNDDIYLFEDVKNPSKEKMMDNPEILDRKKLLKMYIPRPETIIIIYDGDKTIEIPFGTLQKEYSGPLGQKLRGLQVWDDNIYLDFCF